MDHMTLNIVMRARIPGAVKMGTVMQSKGKIIKNALKCAFPYTIPIFAGFWFLGLAYGVYMNVSGFSFWYPMLMSLTIFWREPGVCCSQYASRSLCAGTGLSISFLREVARCSQLWRSPHYSPLSLVQAGDSSTAEMQLLTFLVQAREFLTREKILLIVPSTSMAKKILDELMEANIEY